MNLQAIQAELVNLNVDGWFFQDFRGSDPLAYTILGLGKAGLQTRRWYYWIPAQGQPTKIVHAIEPRALDILPGEKRVYLSWSNLHDHLRVILTGTRRVVMQWSPLNAIPYVSRVDGGTLDLLRSFGIEPVSSADLVQRFEATLDEKQYLTHAASAKKLGLVVQEAFDFIAQRVMKGEEVDEFAVQQSMVAMYRREGMITDHPPIVAVNDHAADPHYAPDRSRPCAIKRGDLVLIDLWAKEDAPGSIFADQTWMGFVGKEVPTEIADAFSLIRDARDAAINAITIAQREGRPMRGCDLDDICRAVIVDGGFGQYFCHRTGHSIHETDHGNGANIDNLETRDERRLIPRSLFSIEPGIYLPGRFGVRTEVNVFLPNERQAIVTGPAPQKEIQRLIQT